jgi:histidinol dehydrogenase
MQLFIHQWNSLDQKTRTRLLERSEQGIESLAGAVAGIVDEVRTGGDEALRELTARFDRVGLGSAPLRVTTEEFDEGMDILQPEVRAAIDYAVENVRLTHERQRHPTFRMEETRPGVRSGERWVPVESVGLYVPHGRGSFPSMLYMLAIPARIAGVDRIALATPPGEGGKIDPACLYAARICGIDEIYRVGGAQAIAAFAYGTESIQRVTKIVGPGSAYVAAAKRAVRDVVDVGLPAGPSESMIVADGSADARTVAMDLLIEAEHGGDSQALLVTTDHSLGEAVAAALPDLIDGTPEPRRGFLVSVFNGFGGVIVAADLAEAANIVNQFAPEHLQIRLSDPEPFIDQIRNAGEILLGPHSAFSLANYAIGPNAVLPTGGGARVHSGVSIDDFLRRVAVMEVTDQGYREMAPHVIRLAEYEGFHWHAEALKDRFGNTTR